MFAASDMSSSLLEPSGTFFNSFTILGLVGKGFIAAKAVTNGLI